MDRLKISILFFALCACSYYDKNSNESKHLSGIYFGDQYTLRFYNNVFKEYAYWKVYDKKDKELYEIDDEEISQLGIDSLKGDTLFAYQFGGRRNDVDSQYQLVDTGFLKIYRRKMFQFGAINSKNEVVFFWGRNRNTVYFKNYERNVLDTVYLNDIYFSGKDIFLIKKYVTENGMVNVRNQILFSDSTNQKLFFQSLGIALTLSKN